MVKSSIGKSVGVLVGGIVGAPVGGTVGAFVGDTVGANDGAFEVCTKKLGYLPRLFKSSKFYSITGKRGHSFLLIELHFTELARIKIIITEEY